jgi:hypothetical protein
VGPGRRAQPGRWDPSDPRALATQVIPSSASLPAASAALYAVSPFSVRILSGAFCDCCMSCLTPGTWVIW